jgi:hypothetical protein
MLEKREGMRMEFEWSGASECQSSSSKPWMKVLLSRADESGEIFCCVLDFRIHEAVGDAYLLPTKNRTVTFGLHVDYDLGCFLGPWKMSTHESTSYPVQEKILGASFDRVWDGFQSDGIDPET